MNDLKRPVHHLRYLNSLRIRFDPSPSAPANIGGYSQCFGKVGFSLKKSASTRSIILVFSTIWHRIQESLKPGHCLDNSPELIERFFSYVLPAQSSSLKRLRIRANFVTRWSKPLLEKYLTAVEQCRLLVYICCWVSISFPDVEAGRSGNVVLLRRESQYDHSIVFFNRLAGCKQSWNFLISSALQSHS